MNDGQNKAADGAALWTQARKQTLGALADEAPELDETDLAAYLEGTLDTLARARVEAALATCPESLELLLAAREAMEEAAVAAPASLVARAQALVRDQAGGGRPRRNRPFDWFAPLFETLFQPRGGFAYAGVTAAFLLVSLAGFELGRAEVGYSAQVDGLLAQEFVGLIDRDGEDLL